MSGIIVLALLASVGGTVSSKHYHIVPANSTNLCQHYPKDTCFTLDQLSSQVNNTDTDNITVSFLPGVHLLTWNMKFNGSSNVVLKSEQTNHSHPKITCTKEWLAGFDFDHINTLSIEGLDIEKCHRHPYGGAVAISFARNVTIRDCVFQDNLSQFGGGAVYLYHSNASIESCQFSNNVATGGRYGVGGGVLLIQSNVCIDSCVFKSNFAQGGGALASIQGEKQRHVYMLSILNSTFSENRGYFGGALHLYSSLLTNISQCKFTRNTAFKSVKFDRPGLGGAIYSRFNPEALVRSRNNVYEWNNATDKGGAVWSESSMILEGDNLNNNVAYHGAAILGGFPYNDGETIVLINCNLKWNSHTPGGAGLVYAQGTTITFKAFNILIRNVGSVYALESTINVQDLPGRFGAYANRGDLGGVFTVIDSTLKFHYDSKAVLLGNKARYGGAIYLEQSSMYASGDVNMTQNTASMYGGAIYSKRSEIEFMQSSHFKTIAKNVALKDGGGLYLSASTVKQTIDYYGRLHSTYIEKNTAKRFGGGLSLEQTSKIQIVNQLHSSDDIKVYVRGNSALKGGGMFVSDYTQGGMCQTERPEECFVQTLNPLTPRSISPTVSTIFEKNKAVVAGSDIYGGLLDRCADSPLSEFKTHFSDGIEYLKATGWFDWAGKSHQVTNTSQFFNHISSDPVRVCFCKNNVPECTTAHPTVYTRKGERFTVSVAAVDQVSKPVHATLISSLSSEDGGIGRLKEGQQLRQIEDRCTDLEYNVFSNESKAVIQLYADGPCGNQGASKQEVNITLLPCNCPIGFERYDPMIGCVCNCDHRLTKDISNCKPENGTVQIKSNVWIEYINSTNSTDYVTLTCPFDYCVQKPIVVDLADTDEQCAFNRTGKVCGECTAGLSMVFASSACQECSNYSLFLILPFAVAGIALVAFILLLNMTVATGTIHGLILYANILAANRSIFLPFDTPNFLTVFISWLNLDLGIETCFYDGMTSYGKFLLQLVFPAYVFSLIAVVLVVCNSSQRIAHLFGKRNPEATLHTLILLSYSKLIRVIITALQFTTITYPDGTTQIVWLYDPNVLYFTASHIPRFVAALAILIITAGHTGLLLFGQLFDRCSEYRLMKWTTSRYYIHFMKAHHAPLADKHRYWVGLLLLVRLAHSLLSAFATDSIVILSVGIAAFSLILYKQLSRKGIYQTWILSTLETSFLANLVIIAMTTMYIRDSQGSSVIIALISMATTFVTFVGIVAYHLLGVCIKKSTQYNRIASWFKRSQRDSHLPFSDEAPINDEDADLHETLVSNRFSNYGSMDSGMASDEQHSYVTPPIIRYAVRDDQLREPALDVLVPIQPEDYHIPPLPPRPRNTPMTTYSEID